MSTTRLEVTDPLGRRRVSLIDRTPFTIGRGRQRDLLLTGTDVSRAHAEIVREGPDYRLRDCGSRAGTFVNNIPVEAHTLGHGDRIRIGRHELRFLLGEAEPDAITTSTIISDFSQMATLLEGLRALGSGRVLDQVLAMVLDSAIALSAAQRGFIMLATPGGLEFKVGRDRSRTTLPGGWFQTSRRIPEGVFATRQPTAIADLPDAPSAAEHAHTVALGIRNVVCVPLKLTRYAESDVSTSAIDECIGVLYLDSHEKRALQSPATVSALESLAVEAAVVIDSARLYRDSQAKKELERELAMAKAFQQALLPQAAPSRSFFDAAATMVPCRAIGGDFFEYFDLGEEAVGFTVGDVAGKGVAAGLLAARAQEIFAAVGPARREPAAIVADTNRALVRRGLEARFVTLFFGLLFRDGRLLYCNAGHNPPMLIGHETVQRLDRGGLILGCFADAEYQQGDVRLQAGDLLVMFSDGVSEAADASGWEYGDERLLECVTPYRFDIDPRQVVEGVLASVRGFTTGTPQRDDMTVLAVRYRG